MAIAPFPFKQAGEAQGFEEAGGLAGYRVEALGDIYAWETGDREREDLDPGEWGWAGTDHQLTEERWSTLDELAVLPGFNVTIWLGPSAVATIAPASPAVEDSSTARVHSWWVRGWVVLARADCRRSVCRRAAARS